MFVVSVISATLPGCFSCYFACEININVYGTGFKEQKWCPAGC